MSTYTSTTLTSVLVQFLQQFDPELVGDITPPDPMVQAVTPIGLKQKLVAKTVARHGTGVLLNIGQFLSKAEDTPVVTVLRQSHDAAVTAEKWMRMERYYHADCRTVIDSKTPGRWTCQRKTTGQPATFGENCLMAGLLFGLLSEIGHTPRSIDIAGQTLRPAEFTQARFALGETGHVFSVHWSVRSEINAPQALPVQGRLSDRLADLLAGDPGRSWRIDDAARPLALSRRSLQRRLADEGRSFSSTLRRARLREAARLLSTTNTGLADIGYCCGYADQAHFQRDFRRVVNVTPRQFRQISDPTEFGTKVQ